jgi:hypothetical protein
MGLGTSVSGPSALKSSMSKGEAMNIAGVFAQVANKMRADIEAARSALSHPGLKGGAFEETFRQFLKAYLPSNLDVSTGQMVDSRGGITRQLDVVISDRAKTPILYQSSQTRVIPIECVYAVIEVKAHLDTQELDNILANMDSVRALEKLAFEPDYPVVRAIELYGQSAKIWPVMYFVFAFAGIDLQTITENLAARQKNRPLNRRVDMICVLDQGVICNCPPDQSMYTCVPTPGSLLTSVRTKKALLLFYTLLSAPLSRVWMPIFEFTRYLGQMTFGVNEVDG